MASCSPLRKSGVAGVVAEGAYVTEDLMEGVAEAVVLRVRESLLVVDLDGRPDVDGILDVRGERGDVWREVAVAGGEVVGSADCVRVGTE